MARLTRSYPSPSPICLHVDLSVIFIFIKSYINPLHLLLLFSWIREDRYGRTLALSSLHTPTGLCQQVTIGPSPAATTSTHVQCVFCVLIYVCVCSNVRRMKVEKAVRS